MFFVRAKTSGPWRTVDVIDIYGNKVGEKVLIMAAEAGAWSVNNEGVKVEPGLVLSFRDANDADWFLKQRRAQMVSVEPDSVVAFYAQSDAEFFVKQGLAERMSEREVQAFFAQLRGEPEPEPEPATFAASAKSQPAASSASAAPAKRRKQKA